MTVVFVVCAVILAVCLAGKWWLERDLTPQQRAAERAASRARLTQEADRKRMALVCPHCQSRGTVSARSVTNKRGISGGKATGALLTGGASMLATGLSRKERATRMRCSNCGTTWDV